MSKRFERLTANMEAILIVAVAAGARHRLRRVTFYGRLLKDDPKSGSRMIQVTPMRLLRIPHAFDHPDFLYRAEDGWLPSLAHIRGHHCTLVAQRSCLQVVATAR